MERLELQQVVLEGVLKHREGHRLLNRDMRALIHLPKVLTAALLLAALLPTQLGCSYLTKESLVEVWSLSSTGTRSGLISYGVAVGDGLHALTIMTYLDYVRYSPGPVQVISSRTIQNSFLDGYEPTTGFTLLKLESRLSLAPLAPPPKPSESVLSWELKESRWTATDQGLHVVTIPGRPTDAAFFNVSNGQTLLEPVLAAGTVVTDKTSRVLGLAEPLSDAIRLGNPPPTIAVIGIGMALMKPASSQVSPVK